VASGARDGTGARAARDDLSSLRQARESRIESRHFEVHTAAGLAAALDLAFEHDRKAIVEAAVPDAREIECAVLGDESGPETSIPGEIVSSREFYDYEAKYLDDQSRLIIPAALDPAIDAAVREQSADAFRAIDGSGLARVDFLLSRTTGELFLNEINTLPGFTTISMFAKLWQATGVDIATVIDRLIAIALARHADKHDLRSAAI
jgi:D-alanine-D-alanine ligase